MSEKYYQMKIKTDNPVNDLIVGFLSNVGAEGFIEEDDGLSCYFESGRWNPAYEREVSGFLTRLKEQREIGEFSVNVDEVVNQDWNKQWEDSVMPVEVTPEIVIKPSWKEYAGTARVVIEIDPKMSFGTGHHETTRMMVQMLSRYIKGNERVLDVGTGTGVLAIAAVKLGARACIAIDRDDWSIDNARENITTNNAAEKIQIVRGEMSSVTETGFDLVSANLNRNTLIYIGRDLYERCRSGGILLVTGILTLDEKDVVDSFGKIGFRLVNTLHEGEWSALAFSK